MKVDSNLPIDVGLIIDESSWTKFQKLLLILASFTFIVDSLANNILSVTIPAMIRDWHVGRGDFSPVIAVGWVGVALGTIIAGSLADRFGRKPMLLSSILVFGLATAFGALVTNMHQLLILRFIDGFGIGGAIPTATTLLAEFTPARRRSRAVITGMICIPIGVFLGGMIGSAVLPHFGWRSLFAINGALAVIVCVVLLVFMPESPRFLALKASRRKELRRVLMRLNIELPADAQWVEPRAPRKAGSLRSLFDRDALGSTLGLWGGFFFCFMASYSSLSWMPSLLSSRGYGLGVASLALSASGVGGIVASLLMSRLVEIFGSRTALVFPAVSVILSASALVLMPLDPARSAVPVLIAIAVLGLSLNALTGLAYSVGAFVYPSFIKGTGLGAAGAVGRVGALTSSYSAVAALAIGSEAFFGFIAVAALISIAFLFSIKRQIPNDKLFLTSELP